MILDSLIIFACTYLPIAFTTMSTGDEYGMVSAGMTIFCASCFIADFWIMMKFHQHEPISTLCLVLMFLAPHFFYAVYSVNHIPLVVKLMGLKDKPIFEEFWKQTQPLVILTYLLVILVYTSKDIVFNFITKLFEETKVEH